LGVYHSGRKNMISDRSSEMHEGTHSEQE
jgi:hypothetical protein